MNFLKRICLAIGLLFKKSSQGVAASTGLATAPALLPETEKIVVKEQEDNYHKHTMNKSFLQHQYDKLAKEYGIDQNPYATIGRVPSTPVVDVNWYAKMHPSELKSYLEELKMTEEEFKHFRKQLEAKTKKNDK